MGSHAPRQLPIFYKQRICDISTVQTLQAVIFPGARCVITVAHKRHGYDYPVTTFAFHIITITLWRERQPQFLQLPIASEKGDYSEETAREIDCEVRRIIDEQYGRMRRVLEEKKAVLQQGAKLLNEGEVITGAELKAIIDVEGEDNLPGGDRGRFTARFAIVQVSALPDIIG